MRMRFALALTAPLIFLSPAARAEPDAVAQCKTFFDKFQKCIDGLSGEQKNEATIFMKTLRGTLGLSDDLNQGDPMMIGIMCSAAMEETKKEPSVQKYNCTW